MPSYTFRIHPKHAIRLPDFEINMLLMLCSSVRSTPFVVRIRGSREVRGELISGSFNMDLLLSTHIKLLHRSFSRQGFAILLVDVAGVALM